MKRHILAAAVTTAFVSNAHALTVFEDENNTFNVGGRIGIVANVTQDGTHLRGDSSRINFVYGHDFQNGWSSSATAEWGFRELNNYNDDGAADDVLFNRLGNIQLSHNKYGSFTVGKQWSAYYDIAGWTDMYNLGGAAALGIYDDGDISGTGRADDAFIWRNSFNNLNISAQYQFERTSGAVDDPLQSRRSSGAFEREYGYQLSLSYDLPMGLSIGGSFGETAYETEDDVAFMLGALKYQNEKVYLAAAYGQFENMTNAASGGFDQESEGIEIYARYSADQLMEGLSFNAGYNNLDVTKDSEGNDTDAQRVNYMIGTAYTVGPMLFAAEYTIFDNKDGIGGGDDSDQFEINARYYF
ncbi:porin [Photobacterium sanctipauli]|uniref:Porin n=1 Tax=Photobacterium sanctipauli TaxID=1342794 RepID=A0A2T3NWH6_9GAMM|nr:porin [Photobacterium sanctipauli]PSW20572.1 porin [Photobacterium sanctipauli]